MAYQMAATMVTLNDLERYLSVAGLFKCNPSNICATFTRFQLTACSHGSSASADLLVRPDFNYVKFKVSSLHHYH